MQQTKLKIFYKKQIQKIQFNNIVLKSELRKKILKIRKVASKNNLTIDFNKVFNLIKKNYLIKKSIGGYFPVNYEVDDLKILKEFAKKNYQISLPVIKKNFNMDFYKWSFDDPLKINQYGIPEPNSKKLIYPDVILVPLVAFDNNLNRLGYGGGYYDRVIKKLSKKKKILKIGLAFSIQQINNVPVTRYDKKLDHIVTDKYIL